MHGEPFERPGESTSRSGVPGHVVDVSLSQEPGDGPLGSGLGAARKLRVGSVAVVAAVALLVGIAVGTFIIGRSTPRAIPITLDSFPEDMFGVAREDVGLRDGGAETVMERLDSHFEAEVNGYRLAYGGEGAAFTYANFTTLEIVNGQLVTEIPISGDTEWANDLVISLNTRDTMCVSSERTFIVQYDGQKELTDQSLDEFNGGDPDVEITAVTVFTDCVLFDRQRNLALRLSGPGPNNNVFEDAGAFRDELERIHEDLTA